MEEILDFSKPVDVDAIERVVRALQEPNAHVVMAAQEVLSHFMETPDGYTRIDAVLQQSQDAATQHFALQVLERAVLGQWNTFPQEQQQGIRDFLVGFLMAQCGDLQTMRANRLVVFKTNATLISVAKREWPHRWPTFVSEVVSSAEHGPAMAENAVVLLEMLVEEIFIFGERSMTKRWIDRKKRALAADFSAVWDLCGRLLLTEDPVLQRKVLSCVEKYVPYVEVERALDEGFLFGLCHFVERAETRDATLRVLTEVAGLTAPGGRNDTIEQLFLGVMERVIGWLPQQDDCGFADKIQMMHAAGTAADEQFLDALSLFLTKFLPKHITALQFRSREALVATHDMLIGLLRLEHKEIFKTCVDYVWWLGDFLKSPRHGAQGSAAQIAQLLEHQLSEIRMALVLHMAKPEEVIIVEDEFGELHSEYMTDVETLSLYLTMRDALVFLTHLDHRNMLSIVQRLMARQVDGSEFSWGRINVLCWSFGAISGALTADVERNAFVSFLRDLLTMCEKMNGRENRAVIASGIMYVVGQYPRFLNNHPRFLRTVVAKNCDFMKEPFPGVKDMAVDTLVKVLKQCAPALWDEASGVFAREMIGNLDFYASELKHSQTCTLYEAMGNLMACCPRDQRHEGMMRLLETPNSAWQGLLATAAEAGLQAILGTDDLKSLIHALRCINRAGKTSGGAFIEEIQAIYWQLQELYTNLSAEIVRAFSEKGEAAKSFYQVKLMRTAKKEILRTIEYFIASAEDLDFVANQCIPQLFRVILADYTESVPIARDPQVLAVLTAAVKTLKGHLSDGIATILSAVFDSTAELIVANAEDFPEHRVGLFSLIKAINSMCFEPFLAYVTANPAVMSGVLWAAKHIEHNTCVAGLDALFNFLQRVAMHEEAAAGFLTEFAATIVNDTLIAMLDTMHRPVFKRQVEVLQRLFQLAMNVPPDAPVPYSQSGIEATISGILSQLPTLSQDQVDTFTSSCFAMAPNLSHLYRLMSDLMIEVQVWNAEQETLDAKAEERAERENAIEGLARPSMGARYSEMAALDGELQED